MALPTYEEWLKKNGRSEKTTSENNELDIDKLKEKIAKSPFASETFKFSKEYVNEFINKIHHEKTMQEKAAKPDYSVDKLLKRAEELSHEIDQEENEESEKEKEIEKQIQKLKEKKAKIKSTKPQEEPEEDDDDDENLDDTEIEDQEDSDEHNEDEDVESEKIDYKKEKVKKDIKNKPKTEKKEDKIGEAALWSKIFDESENYKL